MKTARMGLLAAGAVLAFDQASKWFCIEILRLPERAIELTSFFNLVMVWNTGVSFGMFAGNAEAGRWALVAMASLITSALLFWLARAKNKVEAVALGLVVGGATGNIVDRVFFGAVADFFDFHVAGYHWPAFNIADSAISVGVALLIAESLLCGKKKPGDTKDTV